MGKPGRRAFTLIELLVVVAIIGLLLSILLPTLAAARGQARTAVCSANLRAMSHGWHMYADENNDICLPGRYGSEPGGASNPANLYPVGNGKKMRPRWIATMGKYVGLYAFDRPDPLDDRQDYDGESYRCAAAPERLDERNHAWGYNYQFMGNARKVAGRFIHYPVNRSRLTRFTETVMAADSMGTAAGFATSELLAYNNNGTGYAEDGNHAWSLDPPRLTASSDRGSGDAGSPRTAVDPRHRGKTNAIFADGHAETRTVESLGYRRLPDGKFWDIDSGSAPVPGSAEAATNRWFSGTGEDRDPPAKP